MKSIKFEMILLVIASFAIMAGIASNKTPSSGFDHESAFVSYPGSYPTVFGITRANANPSKAASVNFKVTFSKSVTGVDKADFALVTTGISKATVSGVSGTGSTRIITVATGIGSGTLHLNLIDNDTIKDASGHKLGGSGTGNGNFINGETYTFDRTAPKVISSVRADASPTEAATVNFTVTFSEPVTGVDTKDFKATVTNLTGAKVTAVSGKGTVYTVTVKTGTSTKPGTLRLDLISNLTIKDAVLNVLTANFKTGEVYAVDKPPKVTSIVRVNPNPTKLANVKFTVKFSESVTGVDISDFAIFKSGAITGYSITGVTGSGTTWTVTVNTGTGSGTLRLDLIDDDSILDLLSKPLGGLGLVNGDFKTGQVYKVR